MRAKFVNEMGIKHLSPKSREDIIKGLPNLNGSEILSIVHSAKLNTKDLLPYIYKFDANQLLKLHTNKNINFLPKDLNPLIDKFNAKELLKLVNVELISLDKISKEKLIKSIKIIKLPYKGVLNVNFGFLFATITLTHKGITYDEKGALRILGSFARGGREGYKHLGAQIDKALHPFGYTINFDGKIKIKTSRIELSPYQSYRIRAQYNQENKETEYQSEIKFNLKQLPNRKINVTKIVKSILD